MSVRYCATASFARRLEKSQRLLLIYSMRDLYEREQKAKKQVRRVEPSQADRRVPAITKVA